MRKLGFLEPTYTEPCLWRSKPGQFTGVLNVLIHVDDLAADVEHEHDWDNFFAKFNKMFPSTTEGNLSSHLGMNLTQTETEYTLTHQVYIENKLIEFDLDHLPPKCLPATTANNLEQLVKEAEQRGEDIRSDPTRFRRKNASLRYTAGLIRLDIAQALDTATRFLDNPNKIAEEFMDNIWLYLKGTKNEGIYATVGVPGPMKILAYSDAEFGHGIPHATSKNPKIAAPIIGGIVMLGTMPILWFAKKNKNVVLSTAEAELMAAIETTKDIIEAVQMLYDMKQAHETST